MPEKQTQNKKNIYIIMGIILAAFALYIIIKWEFFPRYKNTGTEYQQPTIPTTQVSAKTISTSEINAYLKHLNHTKPSRNPFLSHAEAEIRKEIMNFFMPHLESIIITGSNRVAFIDGKVVDVGSVVDGFRVITIGDGYVILKKHGKTIKLQLKEY